jgi:hypothetical protein
MRFIVPVSLTTKFSRKQVPPCLSDAAKRTRSGVFVGLNPHKTALFVGCVGFSMKSKNLHTPLQSGWWYTASKQTVAYLRENTVTIHPNMRELFGGGGLRRSRKQTPPVYL